MSEKTFKIVGNDISDGYHTFDELYDHRCLLFLALISFDLSVGETAYRILNHFEGWDLVVCDLKGKQVSYHIPVKHRALSDWMTDLPSDEHVWDGHTSQDVIERLKEFLS